MPTENRSSSNHGTRTFTLDSLTTALEQVQALHEISADLIAENVFDQPAQQGQGEPVAWRYCPECGRDEIHHEEGSHKQCGSCHQEWFSDLDYSDVVRKHLGGKYRDKDQIIEALRAQLAEAQALLREAACHATRMEPMSASCLNRIDTVLDRKA